MKTKYLIPIVVLLAVVVFLTGCATGMTPSSWDGMTADAAYAYISGKTNVYAVDLETHAEAWRFTVKAGVYSAPVLTSDGQLIVGGYDHVLYSLDPKDGSTNWQFTEAHDRWIGTPLVANDTIYAQNADYILYALNLDGKKLWQFKADQSLWGTPVSDGSYIYFGSLGGRIYAVDASTGKLAWEIKKTGGAVLGSPVLNNGTLYFSLFTGSLVAVNARSGDILWQYELNSWAWSGPLLDGDTLYLGDGGGSLYALSLAGDLLWKQELDGAIVSQPLLASGELAVGTDTGSLYFVSLDGQDIHNVSLDGQLYGPLLSAGTLVLASPTGGEPLLVAMENGAQAWSFTPAK
jgi:eukaryotic-like serine/threonine-protein kinase